MRGARFGCSLARTRQSRGGRLVFAPVRRTDDPHVARAAPQRPTARSRDRVANVRAISRSFAPVPALLCVDLSKPHDSLFRFAFEQQEQASALLRSLLTQQPRYRALANRIDWSRLERVEDEFADAADRPFATDLWFSAPLTGTRVLLHLILDHKSTPDEMSAWQVTRYTVRSVEAVHRKMGRPQRLPIVLSLIVYHGDAPWTPARNVRDLFEVPAGLTRAERAALRAHLPSLRYGLHDLASIPSPEWDGDREALVARLAIHFLCRMRSLSAAQLAPALLEIRDLLVAVQDAPRGRLLLGMLFSYLRASAKAEVAQIYQAIRQTIPKPTGDAIMNPLERAFEEATNQGLNQGIRQGLSQGISQGLGQALRRLLTQRFGALTQDTEARLSNAGLQQLESWMDRVLNARSIDDALAD